MYWYEYWSKKKTKIDFFKKDFTLMNNAFFGKVVENVSKKNWDIKLVKTERRRNYLVSEPSYHTTNFSQNIC